MSLGLVMADDAEFGFSPGSKGRTKLKSGMMGGELWKARCSYSEDAELEGDEMKDWKATG